MDQEIIGWEERPCTKEWGKGGYQIHLGHQLEKSKFKILDIFIIIGKNNKELNKNNQYIKPSRYQPAPQP